MRVLQSFFKSRMTAKNNELGKKCIDSINIKTFRFCIIVYCNFFVQHHSKFLNTDLRSIEFSNLSCKSFCLSSRHSAIYTRTTSHLSTLEREKSGNQLDSDRWHHLHDYSILHHVHRGSGSNLHHQAEVDMKSDSPNFSYSCTYFSLSSDIKDLSLNYYFINVYGKTHMRATAYILGIVIGFIVYQIHKKK